MLEFDEIRGVLELAKKHGFTEVEANVSGIGFSAILGSASMNPPLELPHFENQFVPNAPEIEFAEVCAPCVGYFRQAQSPVQIGQSVDSNEVVATIVALGLSNDVETKHGGEIVDVMATHEQPVEFGQPLFRIKVNA